MKKFIDLSNKQLEELKAEMLVKYNEYKSKNLKLDMSRGKPCKEQLQLSMDLINNTEVIGHYVSKDGTDGRNYGKLDGITEAKELFSSMLDVLPEEVIIGGNSSLQLMYDFIIKAMVKGVYGSEKPWAKLPTVKFICPSPGYDRHFAICEELGIEMITVDMKNDGPDMDAVEKIVSGDESVKGIWCVPMYSNPTGVTYSDEVVDRFASMKTKAKDFRIFWDNSYAVHHLYEKKDSLKNILSACKNCGNPDRVYIFSSTSKITFAGSGLGIVATSENNVKHLLKQISKQTIGPDKLNQLRHVKFLKSVENIEKHMKKHADILRPKFDAVLEILNDELSDFDIAWWSRPNGGYFISLDTLDGCAIKAVEMSAHAGVTLTNAGATYPYGHDPHDRNIRIAPSFPPVDELKTAINILCTCIKIISADKLLKERGK